MQVGSDTLAALANHWLARFEHALGSGDTAAIAAQLELEAPLARASGFRTDPERTAPRHATRAGAKCVEAIFRFESAAGRGSGVLRFLAEADASDPRAWTLLTTL